MKKSMLKLMMGLMMLSAPFLAQAQPDVGEWEVTLTNSSRTVQWNICIEPMYDWYISSAHKGWKGRWYSADQWTVLHAMPETGVAAGSFVLENANARSMQGVYMWVDSRTNRDDIYDVQLTYKRSQCAPYQSSQKKRTFVPKNVPGNVSKQVIGQWKLVSQIPSQKNMMRMALKNRGMTFYEEGFVPFTKTNLSITKNTMHWEQTSASGSASLSSTHVIKGDRIEVIFETGAASDPAIRAEMAKYLPGYYEIAIDGDKLTLTSNELSLYDHKRLIYHFVRVGS